MNDQRATETPRDAASPGGRLRAVEGEDDPLGAALRALPAERAGAGFTARVLARLDEGDAGRRGLVEQSGSSGRRPAFLGPVGWAALAAALAVALGLALLRGWGPPSGETIAGSESASPETPGAPAPAGVTARGDRAAAPSPRSAPVASDDSRRGGSGAAEPDVAGDRIADPALPAGTVRPAAVAPRAEAQRPAAAGAEPEEPRPRVAEGGPSAIPSTDARSALERMRAELDALRREHQAFEVALAELPEIGRDGEPVVFLGGDEGLGLVLDLGREPAADEAPEAGPRSPSL